MALTKVSRGLLSTSIVDNGNATAITIDSSENVLVGTTDDVVWDNSANSSADNGHNLRTDGRSGFSSYQATAGSNATINVNRTGSDGDLIRAFKSGNLVGSIGTLSGFPYMHGGTGFLLSSTALRPADSDGTNSDADTDLGSSSSRFKDLYLSGGVYLGGTGSANLLDDYEEGTWTPTALNYDGTMTVDSASYEKIGRQVTLRARLDFDGTSDGSQIVLTIPFNHLSGSPGSTGVANGEGAINVMIKNASGRIEGRKSDGSSTSYTDLRNKTIEFTYIYATAS